MTYDDALSVVALVRMPLEHILSMTPCEIALIVDKRLEVEASLQRTIISAGWLAAVLERQKRIPPLDKVIRVRRKQAVGGREELERLKEELLGG